MSFTEAFADAIAYAEGFYVQGSRAQRNNNPGDLTVDITGTGVGMDGPFVIYGNPADGWAALKALIAKMLDGSSAFYSPTMSIAEVAASYAPGAQSVDWAANVAARLGVAVDSTLNDLLAVFGTGGAGKVGVLLVVLLAAFWAYRKGF